MNSITQCCSRYRIALICAALALVQGLWFTGLQSSLTHAFAFPLDDSYIHLQYGKQIARGAYFQYQDGQPVSSGATSFLYAHVLALGYLIGLRGTLYFLWVYFVAWLSTACIYWFTFRIGQNLHSKPFGWLAVALVWSSGWLGWAFWSGMEVSLFAALLLAVYDTILHERISETRLLVLLSLLALCRPEGAIAGLVLAGFLYGSKWVSLPTPSVQSGCCAALARGGYVLSLVGPMLFFWIAAGQRSANGLAAKSLLHNPVMTWQEKAAEYIDNIREVFLFLMGNASMVKSPGEFVLPFTLLIVLVGLVFLALDRNRRWLSWFAGVPLLLVFAAIAGLEVWPLHSFRYAAPFVPMVYLLALFGLASVLGHNPPSAFGASPLSKGGQGGSKFNQASVLENDSHKNAIGKKLAYTAVALALFLQASKLPGWGVQYAEQASTIVEKQIAASRWIELNLPSETRIAINDAGALAYYGSKTVYDFVGLVTNGNAIPYRTGEGALYEHMTRLPEERRPHYAAVFPSWFEEMAETYDIMSPELVRFPDPYAPDFAKVVYRIDWGYAGMETSPRTNSMDEDWVVRDAVDVADLESEREHDYSIQLAGNAYPKIPVPLRRNFGYHEEVESRWPKVKDEQEVFIPWLKKQGLLKHFDIVDAGRRIGGSERFTLHHLTPQEPVYLIMRTCDDLGTFGRFDYRFEVFVNDALVREVSIEGTSWNWYEKVMTIDARYVSGKTIDVSIHNIGTERFPYYASYYYWACQAGAEPNSLDNP